MFASVTIADTRSGRPVGRLRTTAALMGRRPRHFRLTYRPAILERIRQIAAEHKVEVVVAYELGAGDYVAHLDSRGLVKILDGCEPFMFRASRPTLRSQARLWKFKPFLKQMLERFDAFTTVSEAELAWIRNEIAPRSVWGGTVPNGADLSEPYEGPVSADRVIYTGSLTYRANRDAVDFFTKEVWPAVLRACPGATFVVTGQLPDDATVRRLHAIDGVVLAGLRSDYRDFVSASAVLAVPLQEGGGTRIKILDALALGCPVVASSKAIEGIALARGREVLVAESAADFATAVIWVLKDPGIREALIANGRRAAARYSWAASQRTFVEIVEASVQQRAFLQLA